MHHLIAAMLLVDYRHEIVNVPYMRQSHLDVFGANFLCTGEFI